MAVHVGYIWELRSVFVAFFDTLKHFSAAVHGAETSTVLKVFACRNNVTMMDVFQV